jgi:uncharacterized membrane protein YdcZ (DUF606 family)
MRLNQALRDRLRYGMGQIDDVLQTIILAEYGYFAGGFTDAAVAITDRITFSTGTTAAFTAANLSQARYWVAGLSDASTYGYFAGGSTSVNAHVVTADRITFSTGTTAAFTTANLSQAREGLAGLSDASTYGYFAGGSTSVNAHVVTADRITFSTGTTAAFTTANLSQARTFIGSVSDKLSYGYFAGGRTGTAVRVTTADRITFSTGTTAAFTAANLSQARAEVFGLSDASTYGYFAGGSTAGDIVQNTADRITFSTGTTAAFTAANLSQARRAATGASDGSTYGYFVGGFTGAVVTTADRITFSTGTTAAFTAANLSTAKGFGAGLADYAI